MGDSQDIWLRIRQWILLGAVLCGLLLTQQASVQAVPNITPWSSESALQNLVYGASTTADVQRAMGAPPDEIVRLETMYPVIENYNYYENKGTGAASVFVFENGLLIGLFYKSPTNNYMDFTNFLINNGDRQLNVPLLGGHYGFYPNIPFYASW